MILARIRLSLIESECLTFGTLKKVVAAPPRSPHCFSASFSDGRLTVPSPSDIAVEEGASSVPLTLKSAA